MADTTYEAATADRRALLAAVSCELAVPIIVGAADDVLTWVVAVVSGHSDHHGACHECGLPASRTVDVDGTAVPSCDDHDEIVARVARLQFAANPTATR